MERELINTMHNDLRFNLGTTSNDSGGKCSRLKCSGNKRKVPDGYPPIRVSN